MLAFSQGNHFIYNGHKQKPKTGNVLSPEWGTMREEVSFTLAPFSFTWHIQICILKRSQVNVYVDYRLSSAHQPVYW